MIEMLLAAVAGGVLVVVATGRGRLLGGSRRSPEPIYVSTYRQRLPAFNRELNRARRADRPLSVVVFALDRDAAESTRLESSESSKTRLVYLLVGSIVRELLREHDMVAYDPATDRYVLLLVDSDRTEAVSLIARIREDVLARTALPLKAGLAQLPDDGLTISDLVGQAGERCYSWNKRADIDSVGRLPATSPSSQPASAANALQHRS